METELCLLVTLARSHEKIKKEKNLENIHLSSSVCCVEKNRVNLKNLKAVYDKNFVLVIRIVLNLSGDILKRDINKGVVEITIPLLNFLDLAGSNFKANQEFLIFLSQVEGFEPYISGDDIVKDWNSLLNNCLFIFEDINWSSLQLLFKLININISGGSGNRRQYITSTDYNLSYYLMMLGFRLSDIYNSFVKLVPKSESESNKIYNIDGLNKNIDNRDLILVLINKVLESHSLDLEQQIENLKKNIFDLKNSIKNSETNLDNIITKKKSKALLKNKNIEATIENSKRISILNKQIEKFKNRVVEIENQIKKLELDKSNLEVEYSRLVKLSFIELREIYFNKYHNTESSKNLRSLLKYLMDKTQNFNNTKNKKR